MRHVRACGQAAVLQHAPRWPQDGRYRICFRMAFPDRRRRDPDNVTKALMDGLTGVLWEDDDWTRFEDVATRPSLDRDLPRVDVHVELVGASRA